MTRVVEADRLGVPATVFHRFRGEAWTHGYVTPCHLCLRAGEPVKVRRALLRKYHRALKLTRGERVTTLLILDGVNHG